STSRSNATAGTAYSKQLTATGGLGTFTWTVSSGTLPAGLTLTSGGLLSGTPTAAGTGSFTVQASSGGQSDTQDLTLTVDAAAGSVIVLNVGSSATATVTAGQNIVIPVNVDLSQRGAENLASLTVRMAWDTARFTYASSSAGNWVDSNGDPASYTNNLSTAASGYVTLGGYTAEATTASFTLRTITLTARSTASQVTSAVTASNIVAGNASGQPITVTPRNLTVTVNP
ncbi:MAG: hypothetical protein FIB01_09280, partial [Gemmatimonadetes bacterium]|nr:hypothetical protein [Gemmatimonadota bacterium]